MYAPNHGEPTTHTNPNGSAVRSSACPRVISCSALPKITNAKKTAMSPATTTAVLRIMGSRRVSHLYSSRSHILERLLDRCRQRPNFKGSTARPMTMNISIRAWSRVMGVWPYFTHLIDRVDYRHALPNFHITSTRRACPAVHRHTDGIGLYGDAQ